MSEQTDTRPTPRTWSFTRMRPGYVPDPRLRFEPCEDGPADD